MAKPDELFDLLRSYGLRKKSAKPLAALEGNSRRDGTRGERLARQTVEDLTSASDAIERRVLRRDRARTRAARKLHGRESATQRSAPPCGVRVRRLAVRRRARGVGLGKPRVAISPTHTVRSEPQHVTYYVGWHG